MPHAAQHIIRYWFEKEILVILSKHHQQFEKEETKPLQSFYIENFVDVMSSLDWCLSLSLIIINLHLWGRFGRTMFSFDSYQMQLVLLFMLMLPVESLISDTSGVIWQITGSSALVSDIRAFYNFLPLDILMSSSTIVVINAQLVWDSVTVTEILSRDS